MNLSDAIGLELERREKVMDDCEKAYRAWAKSLPPTSINRTYGDVWKAAWDYQQARIEALVQQEYAALEELGKERRRIETLEAELKALTTVEREQLLLDAAARIEALENAAIDAVQGYEAYAESGFEEVLDPPMMALAALLQEPTP